MKSPQELYNKIAKENDYIKRHVRLFSSLTKKEKMIIALMTQNFDVPSISNQLGISEQTVKTHQNNIKQKLSIDNMNALQKFARIFEIM